MARAARSGTRADSALLAACALLALLATVLPVPIRESIAASLRRTVVAPLLVLQQRAERARSAFGSRDAEAVRLDSLTRRNNELGELAAENERLRGLLSLGRQLRWGFVPAQALHGQGIGDEHSLTLTVGEAAGVRVRSAVVAHDGLIGQVTAIDPRTSMVIIWSHPDFRASAMAADGSAFGIIRPHLGEEPERSLLELRGVAFRDALKPGTRITTSGLGGVFPRGIPVGVVLGEVKTSEAWSRTYLVRPAVRPSDVTDVMVLSPQRVSTPLDEVWASPASAEGAVQRVVQAGDSLEALKAAAVAGALARQRQADSIATARLAPPPQAAIPDTMAARTTSRTSKADSLRGAASATTRRDRVRRRP